MAKTDIITIKNWFKTGLKPSQTQFWNTWDSFWHKDEKIPISSIEDLGNAIDNKSDVNHTHSNYATNNADSLTAENVTDWQNKLGINDLDYVVIPTEEAIEQSHPYVVVIDDEGNSAKKNATDFGKVDTVMGVQASANKNVDISGVAMNWTNSSQRFSNLIDKSSDATYNRLPVLDANGNLARATGLYNVLKNGLTNITPAQSNEIAQLLNGGQGSSGAISVNLISPPIIQNRFNTTEYVLLRGANLLLNSTDMSISICDANQNVIQRIPNNQIINNSASELIFYYNFHNFAVGTYYIKITSGVKVYYTTLDLTIIEQIENVNIEAITWDMKYDSSITPKTTDYALGGNVVITTPIGVGSIPKIALKSSEIFQEGDDFYLEYSMEIGAKYHSSTDTNKSYFGIGYSNVINSLVNNSLIYYNISYGINAWMANFNNNINIGTLSPPYNTYVIIIKTGNLFRMIIGDTNYSITLSNNSGYSMFMSFVGRAVEQTITTKIIKAFKF